MEEPQFLVMIVVLVGAIPLFPLFAKRLQKARRPSIRLLGRAFAFFTLWCAFNTSFAAIWGTLLVRGQTPSELKWFFLWLALMQVPALVVVGRLVRERAPATPVSSTTTR